MELNFTYIKRLEYELNVIVTMDLPIIFWLYGILFDMPEVKTYL